MTVAELLESKGIAKEVITGLPQDVIGHLSGYVSEAETKLQTATTTAAQAEEARRQAELERKEIEEYVENYGTSLTKMASTEAENKAMKAALESLRAQGFNVTIPTATTPDPKPAVPGSPAVGGNVDADAIYNKVGTWTAQLQDGLMEHIRLFGTPVPDSTATLAEEAQRARKPIGQYISEKYNFSAKRQEKEKAAREKEINDQVQARLAEEHRKEAEERGSNPNLRSGESSRNSFVKPMKSEDFHKSDGNVPRRQRLGRMLENIHRDVQEAQSA